MDQGVQQDHGAKLENLDYLGRLVQEDLPAPVDPEVSQEVQERLDFLVNLDNLVRSLLGKQINRVIN